MSETCNEHRDIPTGIGGEKLKEGVDYLPMVPVDNVVEWIDSEVEMPFDIKVGEKTELGMFLSPNTKNEESVYQLEVGPDHGRSGVLGRVIFQDKQGRKYRDVDLKGMGYFSYPTDKDKPIVDKVAITSGIRGRVEGIQPLGRALHDLRRTKLFLDLGIRTQRILALIRLKEIVDEKGERMSVSEARQKKIINSGEEDAPVLTVRAYGTRGRLVEIANTDSEQAKIKLEDGRLIVAQEIGRNPEDFSWKDYLEWFMETMGKNIARMHARKWVHGYLTDHNMTLDARVIDLDSVITTSEAEGTLRTVSKDRKDVRNSLAGFIKEVARIVKMDEDIGELENEMLNIFQYSYDSEYDRLSDETE